MCLENNYQIKTWTFQCSQCSRTDMHCSVCTLKGRIDESHVNVSQRGKHTLTLVHTASSPDLWRSEFQAWNSVEKLNECLCLQLQVSTSECNATIPLNSHILWRSVHVYLLNRDCSDFYFLLICILIFRKVTERKYLQWQRLKKAIGTNCEPSVKKCLVLYWDGNLFWVFSNVKQRFKNWSVFKDEGGFSRCCWSPARSSPPISPTLALPSEEVIGFWTVPSQTCSFPFHLHCSA